MSNRKDLILTLHDTIIPLGEAYAKLDALEVPDHLLAYTRLMLVKESLETTIKRANKLIGDLQTSPYMDQHWEKR